MPLRIQRLSANRLRRPTVPVGCVALIAFFAMQVSVDPGSGGRLVLLGGFVGLLPIVLGVPPERREREAELAAKADETARTMAPPVPGVTENRGYVLFTVIDGAPGGNGQLRSWSVAGERWDGACAVWTAIISLPG